MRRKGLCLRAGVIVAVLLSAGGAIAGLFEDGQAAYERGDYAAAMNYWRPLAEQGNAFAEFRLGVMYAHGHGVPQDYAQAAAWCRKAADQGEVLAQTSLGMMYAEGHGVPQSFAQAAAWYRKAADQGEAGAQDLLGMLYANGRGVPRELAQAPNLVS